MSYTPASYILRPRKKSKVTLKSGHGDRYTMGEIKSTMPQKIYAIKHSDSINPSGGTYTLYLATASQFGVLAKNVVFLDKELRQVPYFNTKRNKTPPPVTHPFHKHRTNEIGFEPGHMTKVLFKPEGTMCSSTGSSLESIQKAPQKKSCKTRSQSTPRAHRASFTSADESKPRHPSHSNYSTDDGYLSTTLKSGSIMRHRSGSDTHYVNALKHKHHHCNHHSHSHHDEPESPREHTPSPTPALKQAVPSSYSSKRSNVKLRAHFASDIENQMSRTTITHTTNIGTQMNEEYSYEICTYNPTCSSRTTPAAAPYRVESTRVVQTQKPSRGCSFTSRLDTRDTDDSFTSNGSALRPFSCHTDYRYDTESSRYSHFDGSRESTTEPVSPYSSRSRSREPSPAPSPMARARGSCKLSRPKMAPSPRYDLPATHYEKHVNCDEPAHYEERVLRCEEPDDESSQSYKVLYDEHTHRVPAGQTPEHPIKHHPAAAAPCSYCSSSKYTRSTPSRTNSEPSVSSDSTSSSSGSSGSSSASSLTSVSTSTDSQESVVSAYCLSTSSSSSSESSESDVVSSTQSDSVLFSTQTRFRGAGSCNSVRSRDTYSTFTCARTESSLADESSSDEYYSAQESMLDMQDRKKVKMVDKMVQIGHYEFF